MPALSGVFGGLSLWPASLRANANQDRALRWGRTTMSKPTFNSIVFNLAGGAVLLIVGGYMIASFFKSGIVQQCSMRYPAGQQFALDAEQGRPLTPIELQARAGLREWGILQNTKILPSDGVAGGNALNVLLATTGNEDRVDENGIGFVWPVAAMAGAQSACLSYSVYLPDGFEFKTAGILPGLYGGSDVVDIDSQQPGSGFATRVGWAPGGDVGVEVRSPSTQGYWQGAATVTTWSTGRWLAIEQEVKLNTPGQDDGIVRMWANGRLVVQNLGVNLRTQDQTTLTGVVSDIGYARGKGEPAIIRVSPFIVQWQ